MASSLAPSSKKKMPRSKEFSNNFDGKIPTFWEYFIFLCQAIQKHFGFAVYEVSELEHTMNSLCYCAARQLANQGAQNLCDVHGSLQRLPYHANPTVHTLVEPQTLQITTLLIIWR